MLSKYTLYIGSRTRGRYFGRCSHHTGYGILRDTKTSNRLKWYIDIQAHDISSMRECGTLDIPMHETSSRNSSLTFQGLVAELVLVGRGMSNIHMYTYIHSLISCVHAYLISYFIFAAIVRCSRKLAIYNQTKPQVALGSQSSCSSFSSLIAPSPPPLSSLSCHAYHLVK